MTKKTSTKPGSLKKKTGLSGFAPKLADVAATGPSTRQAAAPAPVGIGPRGGRTANLADRAVAISFRVSKEQYRKLCEARLDKNTTTQGLMELALGTLFLKEWGKGF